MNDDDDDNTVGYRRPPKHSRFKSGQSGNSAGRPSRQRSLTPRQFRRDVLEVAEMTTVLQTADGPRKVTLAQALIWKLAHRAANDHGPSMRLFMNLYGGALKDHAEAHKGDFDVLEYMEVEMALRPEKHRSAADRKILAQARKRTRRT